MDQIDLSLSMAHVTLHSECDMIDVSSREGEPDPDWYFIDGRGHRHYWLRTGRRWKLPTLQEVTKTEFDEYTMETVTYVAYHRCSRCRERITPGTRYAGMQRFIPWRKRRTLDATQVDVTHFDALRASLYGNTELEYIVSPLLTVRGRITALATTDTPVGPSLTIAVAVTGVVLEGKEVAYETSARVE